MKILKVVALGLAIVMLKFLVPKLFSGFENVLLAFFETLQTLFAVVDVGMQTGSVKIPTVPGVQ